MDARGEFTPQAGIGQPPTAHNADGLLHASKVGAMAGAVFGDSETALAWLRAPRRSFGGVSALELLRTEAGAQVVEEALGQLDEGYFA